MFSGSLFSGSGTTSLFGQQQQQQTGGSLFGQKTGGLFGTPTSSTTSTGFGTGFGTGGTTGLFGQSSTGQTVSFILQECEWRKNHTGSASQRNEEINRCDP